MNIANNNSTELNVTNGTNGTRRINAATNSTGFNATNATRRNSTGFNATNATRRNSTGLSGTRSTRNTSTGFNATNATRRNSTGLSGTRSTRSTRSTSSTKRTNSYRNAANNDTIAAAIIPYVMKKYKSSLFMPYDKYNNPQERAIEYMKSIAKYALKYKSNGKTPIPSMASNNFLKYFIKTVLDYGISLKNPEFLNNINYVNYHGSITINLIQVPNNCIICFTTPTNYLGCPKPINKTDLIDNINANKGEFITKFKSNPFCLKDLSLILKDAITFLPGQFYNDVTLDWGDISKKIEMGVYYGTPHEARLTKYEFLDSNNPTILLSKLLETQIDKDKTLEGIIIVSCCRSFDIFSKQINPRIVRACEIMYRYEHFANIVNNAVRANGDDEKYFICINKNKNTISPEIYRKTRKSIKYKNTISPEIIEAQQHGNRSLGRAQYLPLQTGLSPTLLALLMKINTNTNEMSDDILYKKLDEIFTDYPQVLKQQLIIFLSAQYKGLPQFENSVDKLSIKRPIKLLLNRLLKYFIYKLNINARDLMEITGLKDQVELATYIQNNLIKTLE